jgi:hypothetical protein
MIRRRDDPTLIITQTAHGWLAGQFARQWGNIDFQFPALAQDVIFAATNHDNGWLAWEQLPQVNELGQPIDFLEMPVSTHVDLWQQGIAGMALQNRYAALLVSMHSRFLIESRLRNNEQDTEADRRRLEAFSTEQQAWEEETNTCLRKRLYFAPAFEAHRLEASLRLLQVFDWLSLLLCMQRVSESVVVDIPGATPNRRVEIRLRPTGSNALTITPWPFGCSAFEVVVQAHRLPQATYENDIAFQTAWQSAKLELLVFEVAQ